MITKGRTAFEALILEGDSGLVFTREQVQAVVALERFTLAPTNPAKSYEVTLSASQIAEVERLVATYTEVLAVAGHLPPGLQETLDTLNGAWVKLTQATEKD